jgi:hypothetical protein
MLRTCRFLVATFLFVIPSLVQAEEAQKTEAKAKAARTACLAGDVAKGAALLAELYIDTKDANHIYNQGRCFEQNHRYEDAISRFREFLRKGQNLAAEDKADVEKHIAECQSLATSSGAPAAAKAETAAPVPPPSAPAAPPATPTPTPVVATPPVVEASPPAATASPPNNLKVAGIACGAVGLASIGTAIYFSTRVSSLSDSITTSDTPSASDYQSGKTAQTMQWVFYGVGAAALATGSVLYYLGWRAAEPGQTAFAPMVGPGFAGVAAKGVF